MNIVVFQQDGAPPHCFNRTLEYLGQHFLGDILDDIIWGPYFPDMSPPDYFLWDSAKKRMHPDNSNPIEGWKKTSRRKSRIPNDMLGRVVNN